jgi:hypothetical protein
MIIEDFSNKFVNKRSKTMFTSGYPPFFQELGTIDRTSSQDWCPLMQVDSAEFLHRSKAIFIA